MANEASRLEVRVGANIDPLRAGLRAGQNEVKGFAAGVGNTMGGLQRQVGGIGDSLKQGLIQGVGMGVTNQVFAGLAAGASAAKASIIDFNNSIEQFGIGLETMLGSGEKAAAFLQQLKTFTKSTPFDFPDMQDGTRRLLAMGFAAEEIIPTMRAVGNQVAGVGTGKVGLDRVTLALGQMSAKTKVSGEEMRQLTEAGVPAWTILGKAIGKTEAETMKLSESGAIAGDTMVKAFVDTYGAMNLMERQSKTFGGALSNIKDALTFAVADIGKGAFDSLTVSMNKAADALNSETFTRWASVAKDAIAGVGNGFQQLLQTISPFTSQLRAAFDAFSQGDVSGGMSHLGQAVKVALDGAMSVIQGYVRSMFGAGVNLTSSLAQGILSGGMGAVQSAANAVATVISRFLIGQSPPPEGPLSQITRGGVALMEAYVSGMAGGLTGVGGIAQSVVDALGTVGGTLTMDQARTGIAGATGDLKAMESQATRVEGAIRGIDRTIAENEAAQKGVKLQIDDTKRAYDAVLGPLGKQIEAIKSEGAERTKIIDLSGRLMDVQDRLSGADEKRVGLIQKQADLMSRQVDIQSRLALADARQAVANAKGDPFQRAALLAQIDSVRVRQDELGTAKDLQGIDKQLADDDEKRIEFQKKQADYQKKLNEEKKKGKDGAEREPPEPPKEPDYLTDTDKAALAAKREELHLQQQLQGLIDKPGLAAADAAEKQLTVQEDIRKAIADKATAAQEELRIQTELAGLPKERARIEFDVVKALDEQARISREIQAMPLEQLAAAVKREQEEQLSPLQSQADALSRQGELLGTLRGQWQDIASQAKDAAGAMKEAEAAAKEAASSGGAAGGGGTRIPGRINTEEIVAGAQEQFTQAGQRLSEQLQTGFAEYTRANFGPLTGGVFGSVLGGLTFGPLGALVGSQLGGSIGEGVQAQVPDLQARVMAGFEQIKTQGLIPTIMTWWPAMQPVFAQMGADLATWIQEQSGPILAQLGVWGQQFVAWIGPAITELLGATGRALEPWMQMLKDQSPEIGRQIGVWTAEFTGWAVTAGGELLKTFQDWMTREGIPGMVVIGKGLVGGIIQGLGDQHDVLEKALGDLMTGALQFGLQQLHVPPELAKQWAEGFRQGIAGVNAEIRGGAAANATAAGNVRVAGLSQSVVNEELARAVHSGFAAPSERGPGGVGDVMVSQGELMAQQLAQGLANGNAAVAKAIGVIVRTAMDNGIDPIIALSAAKAESSLEATARNITAKEDSIGLFQLNTRGGQGAGLDPSLLMDPVFNTRRFLSDKGGLYGRLAGSGLTGRKLAEEFGRQAEVSDPKYQYRYGDAYDSIIAAIGGQLQMPQPSQMAQQIKPLRAVNQFDLGLSPADAAAACGPAAAITFAQAVGRMPNAQEALDLAKRVGWTREGMGGPGNFQKLTSAMGLNTAMDMTPTAEEIDAALSQGHPVAISTPKHYTVATGGTAAGGLNVGGGGLALGGKEVQTLNEIIKNGGGIQATITLLDQVAASGAAVGPVLRSLTNDVAGVAEVTQVKVDPALQAFHDLLAGAVPAAGFAAGDAVQKMAGQIEPLFNQVATGTLDMEGLKRKLVDLAAQSGLTSGPMELLKDGTIGVDSAMDKVMASLAASNPAFAALDQQVQALGISGDQLANLVLQGLANATGVASAGVLQMGQNIAPLIQQTRDGALSGEELSRSLVTLASNAGVSTAPLRQLTDGLTTADQAFAQVLKSVSDVSPEFKALYDEVQQGGGVTDAVRRQFLNLLEAYSKNQLAVKATQDTQAGLAPATTTTWNDVVKVTADSLAQAATLTQEGMNAIVGIIGATAEPAKGAAEGVGQAIIDGIKNAVESGAEAIAKAAADVVKKALSAARSAGSGGGKGDDDDDGGGSSKGFAQGGIIREPIVGVGLSSGTRYTFGEGGNPEVVLPLGEASQHWEFKKGSKKKKKKGGDEPEQDTGKIPRELMGAAEQVKRIGEAFNDVGMGEAAFLLTEIEGMYNTIKPELASMRDLDRQIARLKVEQAKETQRLLPFQNDVAAKQKELEDAQRGTVANQIHGLDLHQRDLELSIQEIAARAQLRAEFSGQQALQDAILRSQRSGAELDQTIAGGRLKQAILDQQLLGQRRQLRSVEQEIARLQRDSPDKLKAAVDQETSRNRLSLEQLQLKRQIDAIEKAGFAGTVDEQVAQQYSANLLRDRLKLLDEQGSDMDELNQMQQLQANIAGADNRKRIIDLEDTRTTQQLAIDAATQGLQDQLAPLEAQKAVMDAQTGILTAQQQLMTLSLSIREAELVGPITQARQMLQDEVTLQTTQNELRAMDATKQLVYLQDRLRLESANLDTINAQLASQDAQRGVMAAMLNIVTTLNQQIAAAGLVPAAQPAPTTTKKKKALGGRVYAGEALLVGERGMETFVPNSDGWIAPYAQGRLMARQPGMLGGSVNIYLTVEGSVVRTQDLVREIRAELLRTGRRNVTGGLN